MLGKFTPIFRGICSEDSLELSQFNLSLGFNGLEIESPKVSRSPKNKRLSIG